MALAIGEVRRAGNRAEFRDSRARPLPEQQHDRQPRAEQHAVDGARSEHAEECGDRDREFSAAELPDVAQRPDVDQAHDRGEHDRRQHRLRQVTQQARREQHDDQREQRRDQSRHAASARRRSRSRATATCRRSPEIRGRVLRAGWRRRAPAVPGWHRIDSHVSARTSGRLPTFRPRPARNRPSPCGSSVFRSCRLTCGSPSAGRPCGISPSNATP